MTADEALQVATKFIKAKEPEVGCDLVVLSNHTEERSFGWIFFYDSKQHVETGDFRFALAGNAPIVVIKENGAVHETGTARPLDHYLDEIAAKCK